MTTNTEIEISKSVLTDIAATTLDGIEGAEIAAASLKVGEVLRNQNPGRKARALRVTREGNDVTIEVGLNVEFGRNLLALSKKAQQAVRENIELMTGLKVRAVNVTVQNVCVPKGSGA
ncbi:Asp23/Gls24 family envelope stress response protein [Deinococcus sp.]|uniref:Asp23/Gls24 family envelope stress response protein n=1 Tax=Deinococcus sp. TaxID=47478 RepID=UPI0025C52F94|nr:Asp23/Gls24 family envelope stress response protein [Deinococcus sp.]